MIGRCKSHFRQRQEKGKHRFRSLVFIAAYAAARGRYWAFGYAAWRVLQGLLDPDRLSHDWGALGTRVGVVAGGVVHAALSWQAFRLYRGLSAQTGTSTEHQLATEAL